MPEFILDRGSPEAARQFQALDSFTQGYIEAMFFTDEEQLCEESGREMPAVAVDMATMETRFVGGNSLGFGDLAPDTLARIIADCQAFQSQHVQLLTQAYARDGYDAAAAGRDFWYTRNGHGVGYWDRKELEDDSAAYEALTAEMVAASNGANTPANNAAWDAALAKRKALSANSLGERLSAAARQCGNVDSYVGDDGLIYLG